jgi:2-keto-4-pentenoate hydratase/2-oxohepta-3-ene-1,7-dioic acid hydratase in catechol pathway
MVVDDEAGEQRMKIARFTHGGSTRLGIVVGDEIADVGGLETSLPSDIGALLTAGSMARLDGLVAKASRLPLEAVRIEAPIVQPPEFLAIGLNYAAHVAESMAGARKPAVPMVFNKQATCITGPYDPIHIPHAAPDNIDYEGELGVVIGKRCRAVPRDRAHEVVAGWVVVNDVSVRDWQHASATFTMGKSWDTHGPIGPWMITPDELGDPHDLEITTWVDGQVRQHARTSQMLNNTWELIEHISTAFTLLPGTIIATGTPAGVGYAMTPKGLLTAGSVVKITIEGVGTIENTCIAEPNPGTVIA